MIDPGFSVKPTEPASGIALLETTVTHKPGRGELAGIIQCDEFGKPYGQAPSAEWYAEQERAYQAIKDEEQARIDAFITQLRSTLPEGVTPAQIAMNILKQEMKDPGYSWSWHCNVAMPFYDALPENEPDRHVRANLGAGRVMRHLFDVDTMTDYQTSVARRNKD